MKKAIRIFCHAIMVPFYVLGFPVVLAQWVDNYAFDGDMPHGMFFVMAVIIQGFWSFGIIFGVWYLLAH